MQYQNQEPVSTRRIYICQAIYDSLAIKFQNQVKKKNIPATQTILLDIPNELTVTVRRPLKVNQQDAPYYDLKKSGVIIETTGELDRVLRIATSQIVIGANS